MAKKTVIKNTIIFTLAVSGILSAGGVLFYLKGIPALVKNPKVIAFVQKTVSQQTGASLTIANPEIKTELSPNIYFKVNKISLTKDKNKLLELNNLDTAFSFAEVFDKRIIVNKVFADYIFADVNKILSIVPKEEKPEKETKSEWDIDLFDSLLGVKKLDVDYSITPQTHISVNAKNLEINNAEKVKRFVRFDIQTKITKGKSSVKLGMADNEKVYISNKAIYVKNCPLMLNNSKIFIDAEGHKNNQYRVEVSSNHFKLTDILELINTQIVENNLHEILVYFNNLNGDFDFNFKLTNNNILGSLNLNNLKFNLEPVDNLPVVLDKGRIALTSDELVMKGFEGFYDNKPSNKIDFEGTVKDYLKTMDMEIVGNALATNDFFKGHLSRLINYPVKLQGVADTRVKIKSKNNIMDILGLFKLENGENFVVGGEAMPSAPTTRVMAADMHLENMVLDLKSLRYYVASKDNSRNDHIPIFTINSSIDLANNNFVKHVGFEIPNPLPSEFINAISRQNLFKKGTISGNLLIDNTTKYPTLNGSMALEKVRVPSQRTFLQEAKLTTDAGRIHLDAVGKYKRSDFKFNGQIVNEIKFPIIVKDINLSLDYLDIYKLLSESATPSQNQSSAVNVANISDDDEDGATDFDIGNLIIEHCLFALKDGDYKDIHFGNINAEMTLDEKSILNLQSNKFDIAEGHSSLKVNCDLKKNLYNIRLGIKDVNSDIMATSLLDLKREISGKASGLIELNTDNSLKLNGSIKFLVSDGTIQKVGLVEYVLKFAALFRNPLTMISPGIFSDLVNIPEGNFDKISGTITLKNNIAERINIKSSSPQLSSYIAGRYDLETKDTSLRIYTKFSSNKKGFSGFLRNISLNSLANRIPMSSRSDENYYSAELSELPPLENDDSDYQIFLTKVEGDVENNNFLSSLKKIK